MPPDVALSTAQQLLFSKSSTAEISITDAAEGAQMCVQQAGDVLFIPAGWAHATINLASTVAVGGQGDLGTMPGSSLATRYRPH